MGSLLWPRSSKHNEFEVMFSCQTHGGSCKPKSNQRMNLLHSKTPEGPSRLCTFWGASTKWKPKSNQTLSIARPPGGHIVWLPTGIFHQLATEKQANAESSSKTFWGHIVWFLFGCLPLNGSPKAIKRNLLYGKTSWGHIVWLLFGRLPLNGTPCISNQTQSCLVARPPRGHIVWLLFVHLLLNGSQKTSKRWTFFTGTRNFCQATAHCLFFQRNIDYKQVFFQNKGFPKKCCFLTFFVLCFEIRNWPWCFCFLSWFSTCFLSWYCVGPCRGWNAVFISWLTPRLIWSSLVIISRQPLHPLFKKTLPTFHGIYLYRFWLIMINQEK